MVTLGAICAEEVRGDSIKVTSSLLVVSARVANRSSLKLLTLLNSLERVLGMRGSNGENAPSRSRLGSAPASISLLYSMQLIAQLLEIWYVSGLLILVLLTSPCWPPK